MDEAIARDLYVRHTETNGRTSVREYRTWDVATMLSSLQKSAAQLNEKVDQGSPRLARVEAISRAEYLRERQP